MIIDATSPLRGRQYAGPPKSLIWPKATTAAIKKYEKAWDAYDDAILKLGEAEGAYNDALAEDARSLIAAVSSEAPDPGTPHTDKAQREIEYAGERLHQKYTALNAAHEEMLNQIHADPGDVIAQAVVIERGLLERLYAAHAEATAFAEKASAEFSAFGDAINGLEDLGIQTVPGVRWGAPIWAPGFTVPGMRPEEFSHAGQWLDSIDRSLRADQSPDD